MEIANSQDIFQSEINQFTDGLDYVQAYLDNIFIVTKNTYEDHLSKLDTILPSGICPLSSKVEAIQ
jgi:hypothetical protein